MENIASLLNARIRKPTTAANSERAEVIGHVMMFMGEDKKNVSEGEGGLAFIARKNKRFKYWLGRTRRLSPGQIFGLMKRAGEGKNPQALFNWLLKQELSTSKVDTTAKRE